MLQGLVFLEEEIVDRAVADGENRRTAAFQRWDIPVIVYLPPDL